MDAGAGLRLPGKLCRSAADAGRVPFRRDLFGADGGEGGGVDDRRRARCREHGSDSPGVEETRSEGDFLCGYLTHMMFDDRFEKSRFLPSSHHPPSLYSHT